MCNDNVIPFVNLYEDLEDDYKIWQCYCGCIEFHYAIDEGLICIGCGQTQTGQDDEI